MLSGFTRHQRYASTRPNSVAWSALPTEISTSDPFVSSATRSTVAAPSLSPVSTICSPGSMPSTLVAIKSLSAAGSSTLTFRAILCPPHAYGVRHVYGQAGCQSQNEDKALKYQRFLTRSESSIGRERG